MAEENVSQISVGEFETIPQLLASSESLQLAFVFLIIGLVVIGIIYQKFSHWILSQKINYTKPHVSRFVRKAVLPFFAIALVSSINVYIQTTELFDVEDTIGVSDGIDPADQFAKILNSINILVIGWTVSHLVPIALTKRDKSILEREDYEEWYDMRGFSDDDNLFHRCFKWTPPQTTPYDMHEDDFQKYIQTEDGLKFLEKYHTSKGIPVGSYDKQVDDPFEEWKKSEKTKYEKYYENCITGKNQSGQKLKPGAKPEEIYPIDIWREQKRQNNYEPLIPSSKPPGYAKKQKEGVPKSAKQVLPIGIFLATVLGVVTWWGVDLVVLATATGGLALGIGLALKETMENYFAYIMIKKDKVIQVGDRITLPSGYNGLVHKITPRVTYIRHGLNESLAIIPTKQIVSEEIINFTKAFKLVPATVEVGVSYLNDPNQVEAILIRIGKRAMKEVKDGNGNHLARQKRCPYLEEHQPSCGCDKNLVTDVGDPVVRFNDFNASALDFAVRVFVRDYGSQFKMKSEMRKIMYQEFKDYDIRIPWPIRTIYQGDEKREAEEIGKFDEMRNKVVKEYGLQEAEGAAEEE
jgi:small-conductance mechanosensitive channel